MKGNEHGRFEFVHYNMYADDTNEWKMDYAKFGKVGLKNRVNLSNNNILQHAH